MRVIYVDDEETALNTFRSKAEDFSGIRSLNLFSDCEEALKWARKEKIDVAFLDIEMPGMAGIELAGKLKKIDSNIRIFFVTAFEQYALEAFGVKALGYIMKPYRRTDIREALETAALMRSRPKKKVVIQTMPNFAVWVEGSLLMLGGKKAELLALLTDHAEAGITAGEAIACLWPDRAADGKTQTLYRVTFHNLMEDLKAAGVEELVVSEGKKKYLEKDLVECDLYRFLEGEEAGLKSYSGDYMKEYSWAETRNGQLTTIRNSNR